jgi:ABC-type spermidine/putrescine transport system permease subunit I
VRETKKKEKKMAVKEESFFLLLLLFLLALLCFTVPAVESQTTKSVPTLSATEFLGQYTYFRSGKKCPSPLN